MKTKHIKISEEAIQAVEKMLQTVNEGYLGGRVNRSDLVSQVLVEYEKKYLSESIESIRQQSFDQLHYLETMVKLLKESRKTGQEVPRIEIPKNLEALIKDPKPGKKVPNE